MDFNGAIINTDYCNIEDLDPETLEDVEIALYGMLHHASYEEDYIVNTGAHFSNPLQNCSPPPEKAILNHSVEVSIPTIPENASKIDLVCSSKPTEDKRRAIISESKKQFKLNPKKPLPIQNSDSRKQASLKRNPYSQFLIIEGNNTSTPAKKTACEVITLSDEEDSKYASINKSTTLKTTKFTGRGLKNNVNFQISSPSPVSSSLSLTLDDEEDGSESDSSIILLNPKSETSTPSYDTLSDYSDSDIEVLQSSKLSYTDVNLKLNVSQPDNIDDVTYVNPTGEKPNWEKYCSTKWTSDMIQFYDKRDQGPSVDTILRSFPKNAKWYLDNEDRQGSSLQRNRYFGKTAKMRCMNCNQFDHVTKNCREPKKVPTCNICGMTGHISFGCPNKKCLGVC